MIGNTVSSGNASDTDRLAALLHGLYVSGPPYGCDHDAGPYGDYVPRCIEDAARLIAAGVTIAPTPDPLLEAAQAVVDRVEPFTASDGEMGFPVIGHASPVIVALREALECDLINPRLSEIDFERFTAWLEARLATAMWSVLWPTVGAEPSQTWLDGKARETVRAALSSKEADRG